MNRKILRNMVFLLLGKSVSLFGSSVYTFAMGLYVLEITGSGLSFAVTLVLGILPVVLINPLAGVVADRSNRKLVVIAMDLLNGCFLFGLLIYFMSGEPGLFAVYISTFVLNVMTVVFDISLEAAIPDIVTKESLMAMNSASKVIESVAAVLGPMLGGIVYAFADIRSFICINAVSFLFSACMVCFVDFKSGISREVAPISVDGRESGEVRSRFGMIEDIRNGAAYIRDHAEISGAFVYLTGLNFFTGLSVLVPLPYLINKVFLLGPVKYGIIQAAFPVGAILGALLIKRWNYQRGYMEILYKSALVLACSIVFLSLPVFLRGLSIPQNVQTAFFCVIIGTMGISTALVDIPLIYMLQVKLPGTIRGRVLSLGMSLVKTASPLAFILSGILIEILPVFILPLSGGILLLIYTVIYRRKVIVKQIPDTLAENFD